MIRHLAVPVLAAPPILPLLRWRALRTRPLTVLCYHTVGPDSGGIESWSVLRQGDLRAQIRMLQADYEIVSLDTALSEPDAGDRPRAVLTFDDGERGLFEYLLPVLTDTGVPVTIYVTTEQIETGQALWFDRVTNALQQAGEIDVPGLGRWHLPRAEGPGFWAVLRDVLQRLKAAPPEDRERLADLVVTKGQPPQDRSLGPLSREQLKTLANTPGVTIGAHSHGHELLDQIPLAAARNSMARSRALLRDWTGQPVDHFAFPNGNATPDLSRDAQEIGFRSAAVLREKTAPAGSDPHALPRISVGRYDSMARLRLRLVGL